MPRHPPSPRTRPARGGRAGAGAGATPLAEARNLGALTAAELEGSGVPTLEALRRMGWEAALERWVALWPERVHLNAACALIGAIHDLDWRRIPVAEKARARAWLDEHRGRTACGQGPGPLP